MDSAPSRHGLRSRIFEFAGATLFCWKLEQALTRRSPAARVEAGAVALLGPVLLALTGWWIEHLTAKAHRDHRELRLLHRRTEQEVVGRQRAQAALAEANARLEAQVAMRTRELTEVNAALRREVSERARAEAALVEQEKLAATGRMAAQMAHEINNPLAGIKSGFRLLRDAVPAEHPDARYIGLIDAEIDRIARIVHQTLDLYRPHPESPRRLRVDRAVEDVAALLGVHRRAADVRISVTLPPGPVEACLPEGTVHRILFSLVENALEASPPGGRVAIGVTVTGDRLRLTVGDEGAGIPEAVQPRVFEPFFTTKSGHGAEGGVGLGLAVSRSLVHALGGDLTFESVPGQGTTFTVVVPMTAVARPAPDEGRS